MLQSLLKRGDAFVVCVRDETLLRTTLEQFRSQSRREDVTRLQGARVVRGRFTVRPARGCIARSLRREAKHRLLVAGAVRMVDETCEIRCGGGRLPECTQSLFVERRLPIRGDRLRDGAAHELVTEADTACLRREQPRHEALVEVSEGIAGDRLEQPELGRRRNNGGGLEDVSRGGGESSGARKDGVADRVRDLIPFRRERLDHEERIAAGLPIELHRIDRMRCCELLDRLRRERHQSDARDVPTRRELADHDAKGMRGLELVVSIGCYDQNRRSVDPPREQPDDVQCRLVRPVQVLEGEDRRSSGTHVAEQRRNDLVRHRLACDDGGEFASRIVGDRNERSERSRREEWVATTHQQPGPPRVPVAELPQEARLPDAGLSSDQDDMAPRGAAYRSQPVVEHRQFIDPLEERARQVVGGRIRRRRHHPIMAGKAHGCQPATPRVFSALSRRPMTWRGCFGQAVIGAIQVAFQVSRLTFPVTASPFSFWKALQMRSLGTS